MSLKKIFNSRLLLVSLCFVLSSCSFFEKSNTDVERFPSNDIRRSWLEREPTYQILPREIVETLKTEWDVKRIAAEKKIGTLPAADIEDIRPLAQYLEHLKLEGEEKTQTFDRLTQSSLNFLFCADLRDWSCLEKTEKLPLMAEFRQATGADLGHPVRVEENLNIEWYFSKQWYSGKKQITEGVEQKFSANKEASERLAELFNIDWSRVSMAIYGIDGVGEVDSQSKKQNFSMLKTFEGMKKQKDIRAVVDIEGTKDVNGAKKPYYQYPPTEQLAAELNSEAKDSSEFKLRFEWPASNIMHNKFFVFEKNKVRSLWTGSANISKNCIGDEDFANMSIYIQNNEIANAYLEEFDEMFYYDDSLTDSKQIERRGRFHKNKKPNTNRYFVFADGHEVRVHFSPTDDGEHRSILPMIYSAEPGDILRVSMFGSGGVEYVRALQSAAAKGVIVKVFLDRDTSFQVSNSWINKKAKTKLQAKNPYGKVKGRLDIRHTDWKAGYMNHHKTATLSRKSGKKYVAEMLILGSQNWSLAGNDENDENMLSIRNFKGVAAAEAFNQHFDRFLWPTGKVVLPE